MKRPIRVISDTCHDDDYIIKVLSPDFVYSDTWGAPVWLVHFGENHFESTEPKCAGSETLDP